MPDSPFADLLSANADYAAHFKLEGLPGVAAAGVCVLTCMDSRLDPLAMLGLQIGDAKVLRTPGGHLTPDAQAGVALACQLLQVTRVLVIAHTNCAMASGTDDDLRARIHLQGGDASGRDFGADPDQEARLRADVAALQVDPLIASRATVGGFSYDVRSGRLTQLC